MDFKILVTGKNRKLMASDFAKHLEREISCVTFDCPPLKSRLLNMAFDERPQAVIIILKDEDPREIKVYDILKEYAKVYAVSIIILCDEEDRKLFMRSTGLKKVRFLPRQIPFSVLGDRLDEVKEEMATESHQMPFIEYVNPQTYEDPSRKHILVVDDDPQQLLQIKEHLKDFYEVTLINSGKRVLKCLERYKIDLIFLDYMMPEITGPDVLAMIRSDPRYLDIPVVFLTGVSEKETVTKTILNYKPQGYMLKPSTKIDIVTKVIEILG